VAPAAAPDKAAAVRSRAVKGSEGALTARIALEQLVDWAKR
jgi:hypothetical protein